MSDKLTDMQIAALDLLVQLKPDKAMLYWTARNRNQRFDLPQLRVDHDMDTITQWVEDNHEILRSVLRDSDT